VDVDIIVVAGSLAVLIFIAAFAFIGRPREFRRRR
jgi:hypothetical protein